MKKNRTKYWPCEHIVMGAWDNNRRWLYTIYASHAITVVSEEVMFCEICGAKRPIKKK